jgi:hypothetical protein
MKAEILKIAGVKSEKEFYKKFPTEESFTKVHGKALRKAQLGSNILGGIGKGISKAGGPMAVAQAAGDVVAGIQQMGDEKAMRKAADQMAGVSDVARQASMTSPEPVQRKYVRPDDPGNIVQPGQLYNPLGFGTNVLAAKNGTEIANTFAPNTIYTDLEEAQDGGMFANFKTNPDFLKLNSSGQQTDIFKFTEQGGGDVLSQLTAGLGSPKGYGVTGAGKIGAGVGSVAGTLLGGPVGGMIGKVAGQTLGNLVGSGNVRKTKRFEDMTAQNVGAMALNQGAQALQQQNYAYMRDGGMTNPQVATSLEGIPLTKLFAPDPTMDTLRAGGHLKKYTPPSERAMYTGRDKFAMGGDLKTHWGGYAEPISYNPHLPKGGETVMFRGQSHEESDGKGRTGIGITYGNAPVEVEKLEPAVELENGSSGDTSLTVYGNLVIPKFGAEMIGNSKAAGKKFKNYVAELSKKENKQNKIIEKSVDELDSLDVNNPYDLLKFRSYESNMFGANQNLMDIADEKIKLANLQSAINDTAEEYNLVADDLAKGKVKQAKKGASIKKAQGGITEDISDKIYRDALALQPLFVEEVDPATNLDEITVSASKLPPTIAEMRAFKPTLGNLPQIEPFSTASKENGKIDWMTIANQILPYVRPTDAEALDPRQLAGEMFALATNQVEPVQAQTIQPQLDTTYDISLQDIINENEADYRAAVRLGGYNPAFLSFLNARKYGANQKVLGEQFRLNQAMRDKVFDENRKMLNQTGLQNLAIFDQQYGRQQEALSKTKATTQAALNSISAKYLQNQAENRALQTYENLYNYRFDPRFRAMNMNPLAQFNLEGSGSSPASFAGMSPEEIELYAKQLEVQQKKQEKAAKQSKTSRNGALVKAIKSM